MAVGDRTVAVRLLAEVSGYVRGMNQAAGAANKMAGQTEAAGKRTKDSVDGLGSSVSKTSNSMRTLGNIALYTIGYQVTQGVFNMVRGVAQSALDFEDAMARMSAASGATGQTLESLREVALQAGMDTVFTSTEAADAMTELAKAGVSTTDILGGALDGALSLAAAGELDVALAAETAATAMVQFGLSGRDMTHIADLLAAGAGKAQGSVQDMALALRQGGQVASMVGWTIEDTATSLAAFAANGLISSDAGTSLKTMLLRLVNPANKAREVMEDLGIEVYNANGTFKNAPQLAMEFETAMGGLDDATRNAAMGIIFGTDATRAANVLFKEGAVGITEWGAAVNDSGYAADVAARKMDTLRGDLQKMQGTISALASQNSGGIIGFGRTFIQTLDELLKKLGEIDLEGVFAPPEDIIARSGDGGARLAEYLENTPRGDMGVLAGQLAELKEVEDRAAEAAARHGEQRRFLNAAAASTADALRDAEGSTYEYIYSEEELADMTEEATKRLEDLEEAIFNIGAAFAEVTGAQDDLQSALNKLDDPFEDLAEAEADRAEAIIDADERVADAKDDLAEAYDRFNKAETDAQRESAASAIDSARERLADAEATRDQVRAREDAAVAAAVEATYLDGTTDAAIANRDALRDVRQAALESAWAMYSNGEGGAASAAAFADAKEQIYQAALRMYEMQYPADVAAEKARTLADNLMGVEGQFIAEVIVYGIEQASAAADLYLQRLSNIDGFVATSVHRQVFINEYRTEQLGSGLYAYRPGGKDGGWAQKLAYGGWVTGPGGPRSDMIPAWLSNGEYVVNARSAAMWGPLLEALNSGRARGYADGGYVGRSVPEAWTQSQQISIGQVVAHDYDDFRRQLDREQRLAALPGVSR